MFVTALRGFIVGAERKFYPFIYLYGFSTSSAKVDRSHCAQRFCLPLEKETPPRLFSRSVRSRACSA